MQTEIVTAVAVWAVCLARGIIPEGGIVGIPNANCKPKSHLCHAKRLNRSGRQESGWKELWE